MTPTLKIASVAILSAMAVACFSYSVVASEPIITDHILGKATAPVTVDEYVSLTCSHCAEFYNTILPDLEKSYVDNGKVKFVFHDFPLDGVSLKAAVIARCMPEDEFYPFVKLLYKNQASWAFTDGDPEKIILQYAKLGGLTDEKAKACLQDTKLQDAIIAERTDAASKYDVKATPTFVINGGAEVIMGAQPIQNFASAFDRALATKK